MQQVLHGYNWRSGELRGVRSRVRRRLGVLGWALRSDLQRSVDVVLRSLRRPNDEHKPLRRVRRSVRRRLVVSKRPVRLPGNNLSRAVR